MGKRQQAKAAKSRRFGCLTVSLIVGYDENTIGLERPLFFGRWMKLAIAYFKHESEVSEVAAECLLDDMLGETHRVLIALIAIEPGAKYRHDQSAVGPFHDDPPALS
jgi:hypothetical protein